MIANYNGENFQDLIKEGLVVVQFSATWCGPCKMLKPVIEKVSDKLTNALFHRVDIDDNREVAISCDVKSVPTIIIYKDGTEVSRQVGFLPEAKLTSWIEEYK